MSNFNVDSDSLPIDMDFQCPICNEGQAIQVFGAVCYQKHFFKYPTVRNSGNPRTELPDGYKPPTVEPPRRVIEPKVEMLDNGGGFGPSSVQWLDPNSF